MDHRSDFEDVGCSALRSSTMHVLTSLQLGTDAIQRKVERLREKVRQNLGERREPGVSPLRKLPNPLNEVQYLTN